MPYNNIYPATSPYYTTGVTNNKYLDVMYNRSFPKFETDLYWTILPVYQYRPDMLAYDLYSDPKLWWVFAVRNPNTIKDPTFDFVSGVNIYIPKKSTLASALG